MWYVKATDRQLVRAPVSELPPGLGAVVTFWDTFWACHSHFHSHSPRFYREDGGCFLCKRPQSESNCLFYSPCFDVSQPPAKSRPRASVRVSIQLGKGFFCGPF